MKEYKQGLPDIYKILITEMPKYSSNVCIAQTINIKLALPLQYTQQDTAELTTLTGDSYNFQNIHFHSRLFLNKLPNEKTIASTFLRNTKMRYYGSKKQV